MGERRDQLEELREAARERWGGVTAFRLGMLVAETGARVRCPYHRTQIRALNGYYEGLRFGLKQRKEPQ